MLFRSLLHLLRHSVATSKQATCSLSKRTTLLLKIYSMNPFGKMQSSLSLRHTHSITLEPPTSAMTGLPAVFTRHTCASVPCWHSSIWIIQHPTLISIPITATTLSRILAFQIPTRHHRVRHRLKCHPAEPPVPHSRPDNQIGRAHV